jgi:hopanoid biosynthesis associated protein HpnK
MVGGSAANEAIERAKRLPDLGVGLHLVLVEGRPVLPANAVPDLVDAQGRFRSDMVRVGVELFLRPRLRKQLAAEITAQFAAFSDSGLVLDHVNAHKHFHVHPTIASHVMAIGRRFGMKALRVPYEPRRLVSKLASSHSADAPRMVLWPAVLRLRARRYRLATARYTFGNAWSGAMTAHRLASLVRNLPSGVSEIYLHPATTREFEGAAPGYRYDEELAALTSSEVREALRDSGASVTTFTALSHV